MFLRVAALLLTPLLVQCKPSLFDPNPKKRQEVPENFEDCGCTWSSQSGCTLSSYQIEAALGQSQIYHLCKISGHRGDRRKKLEHIFDPEAVPLRVYKECNLRKALVDVHGKLSHCAGREPEECQANEYSDFCSWGAQEPEVCGIDKARLVAAMVNSRLKQSKFMSLIQEATKCKSLGHNPCEATNHCFYSEAGGCEISQKYIWLRVLEQPKILGIMLLIADMAECRGNYEYGTGKCEGECQYEYGFCTVDPRRGEKAHSSTLVDRLCDFAFRQNKICPSSPCRQSSDSGGHMSRDEDDEEEGGGGSSRIRCTAQDSPGRDFTINADDWEMAAGFAIVHSAMMGFERHCNLLDLDQDRCMSSEMNETCSNLTAKWTWRGGVKEQANEDPAPGLSGFVAEIAVAQSDGMDGARPLDSLFQTFLEEHGTEEGVIKALLDAANQPSHHGGGLDDDDDYGRGGHWHGGFGGGGWGGGGHWHGGGGNKDPPPPVHYEPKDPETKHIQILHHVGEDKLWYTCIIGSAVVGLLFAGLKVWPYPPLLAVLAWLNGERTERGELCHPFHPDRWPSVPPPVLDGPSVPAKVRITNGLTSLSAALAG
mmetsp:Transcript_52135/g.117392  ORF Transcript_52135/g.117392 Transcript_52135/m.117392 type:complete len:596 (-) Transcript_52135:105-1892(-)